MAAGSLKFHARHRFNWPPVDDVLAGLSHFCVHIVARGRSRLANPSPRRLSPTLEARLMPIIKAHKGKVAVAVKHLGTGETFAITTTTSCRPPA